MPGFSFYKSKLATYLEQGDLIPRNAHVIDVVLRQYHPYHVEKTSNEFFVVLTQSCDLMPHSGGQCKARYIGLAPVRPLRTIIEREFSAFLIDTPGNLFRIGSTETQDRYTAFLNKLINNNDSRYFFLPARPEAGIAEDMCVMLPLSLAIKSEHYAACREGRIVAIDDLFQAKLGWLLGQQYSRVGTPDWSNDALELKIQEVTNRSLTWFSPYVFAQIKNKVQEFAKQNQGVDLGEEDLHEMQDTCRSKIDSAIDAVFEVLAKHQVLPAGKDAMKPKVRRSLKESADFGRFFREQR